MLLGLHIATLSQSMCTRLALTLQYTCIFNSLYSVSQMGCLANQSRIKAALAKLTNKKRSSKSDGYPLRHLAYVMSIRLQ